MSYLVDALKKAERERYARQDQDIQLVAAGAAPVSAPQRAGPWLWLVAILVASNVALAIYVWRPRPAPAPPVLPSIARPPALSTQALSAAPPSHAQERGEPGTATPPAPAQPATTGAERTPSMQPAPPEHAAVTPTTHAPQTSSAQPSPAGGTHHGHVTYSKVPLTGDGAPANPDDDAADDNDAPDQSTLSDVPSIQINGLLYSTVPGRSFILVGGRRYHEGERLVSGPAVESIGANGATLRYHGERYHVAGPG